MVADTAIASAREFLAPVLNRDAIVKTRGQSLVDRLNARNGVFAQVGAEPRVTVIKRSLDLLLSIHYVLCASPDRRIEREFLYNSDNRRIIDTLLDLISIEGIYPNLLSGVGVPFERRVKSALQSTLVTKSIVASKQPGKTDDNLLEEIVKQLEILAEDRGKGLGGALQERILVDLIAALVQLAYAPSHDPSRAYEAILKNTLDETPLPILFPMLTSLLHSVTPSWFRSYLSHTLSSLPLRPDGVRQTIIFIAISAARSGQQQIDQQTSSDRPSFSLDVLNQASKLLSSVPSGFPADHYFEKIAPQLLSLLDGEDLDMQRAASYIIGIGILGRRAYGTPGTIGWKLFAQPIIETIKPGDTSNDFTSSAGTSIDQKGDPQVLVSSHDLHLALRRLRTLILVHPNPGLTKRLLMPLLLPLWALMCCVKEAELKDQWYEDCSHLLSTYFRISEGVKSLVRLIDHLTWDGGEAWTYKSDGREGINLCKHLRETPQLSDIVGLIHRIDARVETFRQLLESSGTDETEIGEIFLYATKCWLQPSLTRDETTNMIGIDGDKENPLRDLVYAKITQELLGRYKNILAKSPAKIVRLIQQLLEGWIRQENEEILKRADLSKPTLAGIGSIIKSNPAKNIQANDPSQDAENQTEIVSTCLSLLSTILSSPDINLDSETLELLTSLQSTLSTLASPRLSLQSSIKITAANISALIDFRNSPQTESLSAPTKPPDPHAHDRKTYSSALNYLSDTLPPIRAQGLSLLTTLITASSPILDIPSTCILLLSLLQDSEEFIYLSAIKTLGLLATKHSKTVITLLLEKYIDHDEEMGIDQRLRVGETLLKTIEALGEETLVGGPTAKHVSEAMIAVAGRRGKRDKELAAHTLHTSKTLAQNQEAEEAWGGEVPAFENENPDPINDHLAKILESWHGPPGAEDLRIRASALSILGAMLETSIAGVGSSLTSTAIDLSLSILKFETELEKAILRRAAVLVVMSLVRALDAADEKGQSLGFGLVGEALQDVLGVLRYVLVAERDELVVGYVGEVIGGLEVWREKRFMGYVRGRGEGMRGGLGEGRLMGLDVHPNGEGRLRPRIEEVE